MTGVSASLALTMPLAILPALVGGVAAVTARRGWTQSLDMGGRLGVRSEASMRSETAFTTANRVATPVVAGAAVVGLLVAVLLVLLPMPVLTAVVVAVVGLVATAALLVYAGVLGDRAARMVPQPARKPGGGGGCGSCACGSGSCGSGLTRNTPAPGNAAV